MSHNAAEFNWTVIFQNEWIQFTLLMTHEVQVLNREIKLEDPLPQRVIV